jgi:inorganic pyrophosphatase
MRILVVFCVALRCWTVPHRAVVGGAPVAPEAVAVDDETVAGPHDYLRGYPSRDGDDVHAVVEIPAGTTGKLEVGDDGVLRWQHDREHGGRREIDYLPFPVNYGMVPRTLADDGDALDIVVLGGIVERGHVARTRVIGVLEMGEAGERDDKLIAVPVEPGLANGFTRVHDLAELDAAYPNARAILVLWFASYWGLGRTHVRGWGDAAEADAILGAAERRFTRAAGAAAPRPRAPPRDAARALRSPDLP